jgi:replicative DNA helicase
MNDDVELILLSKLINKKEDYYEYNEMLSPQLFTQPVYRSIYNWIDTEYQNGNKFDLLKACKELKDISNIDYYLAICMDSSASYMHNTKTCIIHLNNSHKKIVVKGLCEDVLLSIDKKDIEDQIVNIEKSLLDINKNEQGSIVEIKEHLKETIKVIEKNSLSSGMSGIPSGFSSIDKFTGGWQPQDLIIVGGASSMGKTSFALALAANAAKNGHKSVIFSYEMSTSQLISRLLSCETEIDNRYLIKGTINGEEWNRIHSATGTLEKLPLYIDECNSTSLRYLLNKIRQYVITKDAKLVMIDYLQLVSNLVRGRSREQEVSIIARSLKNIAKELNITVIALSQLSRGVERNEGCRPMLSNLRESGEIEQAADAVVFVYRPEYYGFEGDAQGNSTKGKAEIIFAKGRNIGIGSKWLKWISYLTKFEELSEDKFC